MSTRSRYQFRGRLQRENEDLTTYISELRKLAKCCDFKQCLDEQLRDQFVYGIRNDDIRRLLLAADTLTFDKAQNIAVMFSRTPKEKATVTKIKNNVTIYSSSGANSSMIHNTIKLPSSAAEIICFSCKNKGHLANKCPKLVCFTCNKAGHVSPQCPTKQKIPVVVRKTTEPSATHHSGRPKVVNNTNITYIINKVHK